MKRVVGFGLLCCGTGMLVVLMIPTTSLWRLILCAGSIAVGYILFCKC